MRRKPFTWEEKRRIYCDYTCGARCDDLAQKWGCTAGAINVVVHKMHGKTTPPEGLWSPEFRGKNMGLDEYNLIKELRARGLKIREIAANLNRDESTIRRALKRWGI